jgi:hypothetical protein
MNARKYLTPLSLVLALCAVVFCIIGLSSSPAEVETLFVIPSTTSSSMQLLAKKAPAPYVPDGLSEAEYKAALAKEAKKEESNKKRFVKGKLVESLTEWALNNEKKGLVGKDMNLKGHRMVKAKYDGWYTDKSPI